ncbi:MAG: hypothetical protein MUP55_04890, partial [Candidatus Aenigmarchaeota archaeon]|nr:hypothetical protein [Candidatus Aenigmarchaeota archaeon]
MQDEDPQELIKKLEKLVGGHVELEKLIRQITREEVHKVVQKGAINQEHRRIEPRKPPSRTCSKCGKTVAWG